MFAYFGTKRSIAHLYPEPVYDTIIEPFCGAASYSLYWKRWQKQVKLYDISPHVVSAWRFLIGATAQDVLSLPILKPEERLTKFKQLSQEERCFLGFMISASSAHRMNQATEKTRWTERTRKQIVNQLFKVRHWVVERRDFRFIPIEKATWFVDPPYGDSGHHYAWKLAKTGYTQLATCITDKWQGQIIVCEKESASWLKFEPLCRVQAAGGKYKKAGNIYTEGLYHRIDV